MPLIDFTKTYCKAYLEFLRGCGITKIKGNPLDEHERCKMEIDISKITNKKLWLKIKAGLTDYR